MTRQRLSAAGVAVACVIAVVVGALGALMTGPTVPYDIEWETRWKPGETVTYEMHATFESPANSQVNPTGTEIDTVDAVYVVRCDEVGPDGSPTKRTAFVRSWRDVKDGGIDESLTGRRVQLDGEHWTLAGNAAATPRVKEWLDATLAPRDWSPMGAGAVGVPPAKLTPGEVWKADPAALRAASRAPLPVAATSGVALGPDDAAEIRLLDARGPAAAGEGTIEVKFRVLMRSVMSRMRDIVGDDSAMELTISRIGPLTNPRADVTRMEVRMKLSFVGKKRPDTPSSWTTTRAVTEIRPTAGGEIP